MKLRVFTIPSLVAAGLVGGSTSSADEVPQQSARLDDVSNIISSIAQGHEYTLAAHRSHQSHGSHRSHRSHRSGPVRPQTLQVVPEASEKPPSELEGTRNEMSTPPKSILPSSPGLVTPKPIKVLPGNSEKFKNIVMQTQIALHVLGYDVGPVNGEMHAQTVAAIYQYQVDKAMIPTGRLTHEVLDRLGVAAK